MDGCLSVEAREILIKAVEGLRSFLRAEQVKVVAPVNRCHGLTAGYGGCGGQCTQILHAAFKDLIDGAVEDDRVLSNPLTTAHAHVQ